MKKKLFFTAATAIAVLTAGICIGSVFISPEEIGNVLLSRIFGVSSSVSETTETIIWQLRLPRVLLAFFVGAALSAGGTVAQSILKNPLASPYTIGVSSGASLGVALVIIFGISIPILNNFTMAAAGFIFGIGAAVLSIRIASRLDRSMEGTTIVLSGMIFALFISGILTLVAGLSRDKYDAIIRWQIGSFSAKGWSYVVILVPVFAIGFAVLMRYAKELDILTFGEEQAASLGVETKKVKWIALVIAAVLTGTAVAFSGVIGFIDLAAPHIARKIFSPRHRLLIPTSALIGGVSMVISDLISRTVLAPRELPVSAVTAIIGAPFFAYVFFKRRNRNA